MIELEEDDLLEVLTESEALLADGFEDALIGYVQQGPGDPVALYDRSRCIEILVSRDEMTYEEAIEFFDFNVQGAWVGEKTPAFAVLLQKPPEPVPIRCNRLHAGEMIERFEAQYRKPRLVDLGYDPMPEPEGGALVFFHHNDNEEDKSKS